MPRVRALKTLVCVIYTMPSWSPFSGPQVSTGGYSFLCMACDYVPVSTCFLWQTTHFPICLYQRFGRKQPEISPKKKRRLFIPSSQHLAGSNESISLQSLVACHFPWFQHKPDFISLVEMRDLVYSSCKIPPIGSRRPGKDLYWHLGPSQHGRCVRGLTPTVLHEQKSPPVFRGAEVFRCYYGTFQHGNRRS